MCVGRVGNIVLETRETREKTRNRIFGSGSGRVLLNKISGFSGQNLENPKNSGRVGFRGFSGFCTLYMIFANDMTFLFFIFSLGELQYLNLESNSLDHLPKNLLHKNVHKKLLDVRLSYNKLRIVDTNTFSSLKVKLMTCFH